MSNKLGLLKKIPGYAEKPIVILPSMLLGVLCGVWLPKYNGLYGSVTHLYLALLEMCVLPVMSTAIVSSLGHLIHGGKTTFYLKRMFLVFICSLLGASLIAVFMSVVMRPGAHLSSVALTGISQAILDMQGSVSTAGSETQTMSLWMFFMNLIPKNIFQAFSSGQSLAVLFTSILVGIAVGLQRNDAAKTTLSVTHSIYEAFLLIIRWVMVGLPIGLFFLFASYFSSAGFAILSALSWLIGIVIFCGLFMMTVFTLIIRYRTGFSAFKVIMMLKQPLSLAFFTSSSLATMPTTLNALRRDFKLNENVISLVIPLGTTFNQQASVIRYVCMALFVLQMYGLPLHFVDLPFLVLTSILAAVAGAGLPGIAAITMSSFVLQSLGLPVSVGIILLMVIEPIINPITTMVNVFGNCTAATLVAIPDKRRKAI